MQSLLRGAGGEHELIAYGIILILIMIFMPEGLTSGLVNMVQKAKLARAKQRRT